MLRQLHASPPPLPLRQQFDRETYSAQWREAVKHFLRRAEHERFDDPLSRQTATLLQHERARILDLIHCAEKCAQELSKETLPFVACHADLHAGNLHVVSSQGFYLVDWDTLILAPKERDLMFVGGGLLGNHYTPKEENVLFYQGYGVSQINHVALSYYRCERIIQDIAAFCEQLFSGHAGGEDREQGLGYLHSNFRRGGTIDLAYRGVKPKG